MGPALVLELLLKTVVAALCLLVAVSGLLLVLPVKVKARGSFRVLGPGNGVQPPLLPDSVISLLPPGKDAYEQIFGGQEREASFSYDGRLEVSAAGGVLRFWAGKGEKAESAVFGIKVGSKRKPQKRKPPGLRKTPSPAKAKRQAGGKSKASGTLKRVFAKDQKPLRTQLKRTLLRLIRTVHVSFDGDAVVGLGDPYLTGMTYGMYQAVAGTFGFGGRLRLEPSFDRDVVGAKGTLNLWMRPICPLWVLAACMMSPSVRTLWLKGKGKGARARTIVDSKTEGEDETR